MAVPLLALALVGCDDETPMDARRGRGRRGHGDGQLDRGSHRRTSYSMLVEAAEIRGAEGPARLARRLHGVRAHNEAFMASGMRRFEGLAAAVRGILTYHAISGQRLASTDLTDGPVTTAAMLTLFIDTSDGVRINGGSGAMGANVVTADIQADNGVIHVIDRISPRRPSRRSRPTAGSPACLAARSARPRISGTERRSPRRSPPRPTRSSAHQRRLRRAHRDARRRHPARRAALPRAR